MYRLYFEDLNLKIFSYKRYILHEMLQVTCWSGTRFGFYQYQWPAGPVADPCSCSSGKLLGPEDENYPASDVNIVRGDLLQPRSGSWRSSRNSWPISSQETLGWGPSQSAWKKWDETTGCKWAVISHTWTGNSSNNL